MKFQVDLIMGARFHDIEATDEASLRVAAAKQLMSSDIDFEAICVNCEGFGSFECDECNGSGVVETTCRECNGNGNLGDIECPDCGGSGCDECEHEGLVADICGECNGHGVVDTLCDECDGSGEITCPSCKHQFKESISLTLDDFKAALAQSETNLEYLGLTVTILRKSDEQSRYKWIAKNQYMYIESPVSYATEAGAMFHAKQDLDAIFAEKETGDAHLGDKGES